MTLERNPETTRTLTMPLLDDSAGDVAPLRRRPLSETTSVAPPPAPRPHLVALVLTVALAAAMVAVVLVGSRGALSMLEIADGQLVMSVKQITDISTRTVERAAAKERVERRRLQLRAIREQRAHRRALEHHDAARRQAIARRPTTRAKRVPRHSGGHALSRPIVPAPRARSAKQDEEFPF